MAIDGSKLKLTAPKKRHQIADYLKVGDTYYLMGMGFTSINENYGTQEDGKAYVNNKELSTTVTSYQREFPYNCDLITSEEAIMALREVGERGLTGTDAMFEYVRVDLFLPKATAEDNTEFYARHFIVTAVADGEEGEGAEVVTNSGNLKPYGDMTEGWFKVGASANTFTADLDAYATATAKGSTPKT